MSTASVSCVQATQAGQKWQISLVHDDYYDTWSWLPHRIFGLMQDVRLNIRSLMFYVVLNFSKAVLRESSVWVFCRSKWSGLSMTLDSSFRCTREQLWAHVSLTHDLESWSWYHQPKPSNSFDLHTTQSLSSSYYEKLAPLFYTPNPSCWQLWVIRGTLMPCTPVG